MSRRQFLFSALVAVFAAIVVHASMAQAACDLELQGTGRVAAVLDGRSFRLDDGREVRLAGIEPGGEYFQQAGASVLRELILNRDVTLHAATDAPDRYGRQQAFVFVYGSDEPIQSRLLAQGAAIAVGNVADGNCSKELLAAENGARLSRRGGWAHPIAVKNAENTADILAEIGQFAIIEGRVLSARQAGATFYINFSKRWIQDFAVTIPRRMMPSFEAAGLKLAALEGRRIRVRGWVERRGGPRIEALSPGQIEMLEAAGTTAHKSE